MKSSSAASVEHHEPRHRRVTSIGLISPRHWFGLKTDGSLNSSIYQKLRSIGFQETVWQYVYEGQLGGLIRPIGDDGLEIHVRFYENTIEAEIEVGRRYPRHFWGPRAEAGYLLLELLEDTLTRAEFRRTEKAIGKLSAVRNAPFAKSRPLLRWDGVAGILAAGMLVSGFVGWVQDELVIASLLACVCFTRSLPDLRLRNFEGRHRNAESVTS